jgi:hypothetical protein
VGETKLELPLPCTVYEINFVKKTFSYKGVAGQLLDLGQPDHCTVCKFLHPILERDSPEFAT